ncbi:MAG: hypothetical protein RXR82_08265, partial [Nitrososphaeria archaeon]
GWLYAWLESISNGVGTIWVKIPSSIPAGGTYQLYMIQDSTLPMDGVYWGEAPQLSPTYAQYDNGASVFDFYDNFAGTTLSSKWTSFATTSGGPSYSVNNGLIESGASTSSGTWEAIHVYTTSTYTPSVLEVYVPTYTGASISTTALKFGYATVAPASGGDSGTHDWYAYDWNEGLGYVLEKIISGTWYNLGNSNNAWSPGIYSLYWPATGNEEGTFNYSNYVISSTDSSLTWGPSYIDLKFQTNSTTSSEVIYQWVRTRAYPPNGVMPSVSLGPQYSGELITVTVP